MLPGKDRAAAFGRCYANNHKLKRILSSLSHTHNTTASEPVNSIYFKPETTDPDEQLALLLLPYFSNQIPVLIRNGSSHHRAAQIWPKSWKEYFVQQVGYDTPCTIEIGSNYKDGAVKSTVAFGDYVQFVTLASEQSLEENNVETVYLAQQDIYEELLRDVAIPRAITDGSTIMQNKTDPISAPTLLGHGKLYSTMFWFGPKGCVTPLHHDPMDNLFFQYVGRKRVLLYPPQKQGTLKDLYYAGKGHSIQDNTSAVDVENPDINKFPNFAEAPAAQEALVGPGDVLFIPKRWWHHVRSLETSVSVNSWFR